MSYDSSFKYILAIDCETTGLVFNAIDPTHSDNEQHQSVSWGIILADAITFEELDHLYVEIKWNETSIQQRQQNPEFGKKAESVHGLTYEYLEQHGIDEKTAVEKIGNFIVKYWGPDNKVTLLGHNVATFDLPFFKHMFWRHDVDISFGSRHIDSWTVGFVILETWNSDELFDAVGCNAREQHNALEDARNALNSVRRIKNSVMRAIT